MEHNMKKTLLLLSILLIIAGPASAAEKFTFTVENKHQEGPVGKKLTKPFILILKDRLGRPLANREIESACINSDKKAEVLSPLVKTDTNGVAQIFFKNGKSTKQYEIVSRLITKDKPIKITTFKSMAYNVRNIILYVLGGLALFLFGMKLLSDGLQTSAGSKMKSILAFLSRNKYMGVLIGFLVTAILQSSSITTVMLIGFINAGMMSFTQSIGIIMGANIGTTMTGFIISMKASQIMFPVLIGGFLLNFLGKTNRIKYIGQVFLGLGLVFLGLSTMSTYVKPLKDSVTVFNFFVQFSTNPLLAIIAGIIVTFIIQSSSATLGLIITLGASGLIGVNGAFGLVLGSNIGTTLTAQLAAIGGNINAKRVALTHSFFNTMGMLVMFVFMETSLIEHFYWLTGKIVGFLKGVNLFNSGPLIVPAVHMGIFIAFMHAIFNIFNTILLLPFARAIEIMVRKVMPGKKDKKYEYLEPHLLVTPAIALSQTVNELSHMLNTARKLVKTANEGLFTQDKKWNKKFEKREKKVNSMQADITEYLVQLTQRPMTAQEASSIPKLIHAINDIERIGDLSENIMESALHCRENKVKFSPQGKDDIDAMHKEIEKMIDLTLDSLKSFNPEKAQKVLVQEEKVNKMELAMRGSHIKRLKSGTCKVTAGISFLDIISNMERIGDHLTNVANAVIYSNA